MAEENTKRCHKMNEKAREKRWNRISMEQLEGSTSPELSLLLRNKWNAGPTSLAAKMQIERLRRKYPWAETEVLEDILRSEENDVQRTEERLLEMFPVDDFVATAELDVETGSGNETAQLEGSNAPLVQKEVCASVRKLVAVVKVRDNKPFSNCFALFYTSNRLSGGELHRSNKLKTA